MLSAAATGPALVCGLLEFTAGIVAASAAALTVIAGLLYREWRELNEQWQRLDEEQQARKGFHRQ